MDAQQLISVVAISSTFGVIIVAMRSLAFAREVVSAELARRPQPIGAVKVSEAWQEEV